MKIKNLKPTTNKKRTLTLRISEATMQKVDSLAKNTGKSRQKLVEAILETAFESDTFELDIEKVGA